MVLMCAQRVPLSSGPPGVAGNGDWILIESVVISEDVTEPGWTLARCRCAAGPFPTAIAVQAPFAASV